MQSVKKGLDFLENLFRTCKLKCPCQYVDFLISDKTKRKRFDKMSYIFN